MFLAEVQTFAAALPRHYSLATRLGITSAATGGLGLSSLQQTLPICDFYLYSLEEVAELNSMYRRGQLKCDGTRAETRFRLSAKRTSPFKSAGGVSSVDYWQPRCAHQR